MDKGIIVQLEHEVEGIIPFSRKNKKNKKSIMDQYKQGDEITGVVMEVKPEDKKIILILDDLNDNEDDGKDAIKEYMNSQEKPAGEKIEIPDSMESSE